MRYSFKKVLQWELTILGLVIVLFCLFDFYPLIKKVFSFQATFHRNRHLLQGISLEEKMRREKSVENEYAQLQQNFDLLQKSVEDIRGRAVRDRNIPLITLKIEDMAAAAEIELTAIKPLEPIKVQEFEILPMEIGFQADIRHLEDFLSRIERSDMFITIQELSIKQNNTATTRRDVRLLFYLLFDQQGMTDSYKLEGWEQ